MSFFAYEQQYALGVGTNAGSDDSVTKSCISPLRLCGINNPTSRLELALVDTPGGVEDAPVDGRTMAAVTFRVAA